MNKPITPEEMSDWVNTAWGKSLEAADAQRIGTSDSDKGEYAIHQVRIFQERLAQAIEQMPFGDTAASFAAFVREFK